MANDTTRSLRIGIPVNPKERLVIHKAAKIVGQLPAEFGRNVMKRAARMILKKSGVIVRVDLEDFLKDGPRSPQEGDQSQEG